MLRPFIGLSGKQTGNGNFCSASIREYLPGAGGATHSINTQFGLDDGLVLVYSREHKHYPS